MMIFISRKTFVDLPAGLATNRTMLTWTTFVMPRGRIAASVTDAATRKL